MIRAIRNIAAALAAALAFVLPVHAATGGTDFTDLWYVGPAENGWGLNVIHQGNIIFATLYVYNPDGSPRFFSASETRASGSNSFSGPLYDTRGTYFATNLYNPAAFSATPVGTLTLNFSTPTTGTLTYSVSGAGTQTKSITRFAFGLENLSGKYLGGMTATSSCGGISQPSLIFDTMAVSHAGSSISFTVDFYNAQSLASRCVFSGTYSQVGSLGNVSGTYSCSYGTSTNAQNGNFNISQIRAQQTGFSGIFTGSDNFCSSHSGYFGGVRDVL